MNAMAASTPLQVLMQAIENVQKMLRKGITTVRDCGAKEFEILLLKARGYCAAQFEPARQPRKTRRRILCHPGRLGCVLTRCKHKQQVHGWSFSVRGRIYYE